MGDTLFDTDVGSSSDLLVFEGTYVRLYTAGRAHRLGDGRSLTNQAFGRVLHATNTLVTPQGHKYLYTCSPSNTDHAEEFSIVPVKPQDPDDAADELAFTGYFNLTSVRTNMGAAFGEDITPAGRARIHQEPGGSKVYFY